MQFSYVSPLILPYWPGRCLYSGSRIVYALLVFHLAPQEPQRSLGLAPPPVKSFAHVIKAHVIKAHVIEALG